MQGLHIIDPFTGDDAGGDAKQDNNKDVDKD